MGKRNPDWQGWVITLSGEFEAVAAATIRGSAMPQVPAAIAAIEHGDEGAVTGNQSAVAAQILGHAHPSRTFRCDDGFHGKSYAGWAEGGEVLTGRELAYRSIQYQFDVGLHGPREPWGYGAVYREGYILAALSPNADIADMGRRCLWGQLAVLSLMWGLGKPLGHGEGVVPMGCRTPGDLLDDLDTQAVQIARGEIHHISKRNAGGRVLREAIEAGLLTPPPLQTPEDAVAVIRETEVRCALGWRWGELRGGGWTAMLERATECERKRGVSPITVSRPGEPVRQAADGFLPIVRSLTLAPDGLYLFGDWPTPAKVAPPPPPEPEEPGEPIPPPAPPGEPSDPHLQEAKARLEALKGNAKLSRRFRVEVHEIMVLLNKGGAW